MRNRLAANSMNLVTAGIAPGKDSTMDEQTTLPGGEDDRRWWYQPEVAMLVTLVTAIYFCRLTTLPICGEESRWARGAVEMIQTGDWVVPRQQGQPFLDRPPLGSWLMAIAGLIRGKVDLVAVRLPSVVAILLTTFVIFAYARSFLSRFWSFACGAIYCTLGQVLELGRLGENDTVFALCVSTALLAWHCAYTRGWSPWALWATGYGLAAIGAMQKGLQSIVYFAFVTTFFLAIRRDWRTLLSPGYAAGIATLVVILSAWVIPFYFATDLDSTIAIWTQTVTARFGREFSLTGLAKHMATFPLKTFACLLPWSPFFLALLSRRAREAIGPVPPQIIFLATAVLATYPSLLLATDARTRYFISLYPCLSILLGWIMQRCAAAEIGSEARRAWNRYLVVISAIAAAVGVAVVVASLWPTTISRDLSQPLWFAFSFGAISLTTSAMAIWSVRQHSQRSVQLAVIVLSVFLGLSYTGVVINAKARRAYDMSDAVAALKLRLPQPTRLVSFGPINHRFAYFYESLIEELLWPVQPGDVPSEVVYFCYDRRPGDTVERRFNGRLWNPGTTPGTLPMEWEEIAVLPTGRNKSQPDDQVVVGRIVSSRRMAGSQKSGVE